MDCQDFTSIALTQLLEMYEEKLVMTPPLVDAFGRSVIKAYFITLSQEIESFENLNWYTYHVNLEGGGRGGDLFFKLNCYRIKY